MGVTLRIRFNGRKKDLSAFWVPVVFELKRVGSTKPLRFVVENLDRRRKKGYEFEGSIEQTFSKWEASPCYLRMEAASGIDPKTSEALFRCVTNPIWIAAG